MSPAFLHVYAPLLAVGALHVALVAWLWLRVPYFRARRRLVALAIAMTLFVALPAIFGVAMSRSDAGMWAHGVIQLVTLGSAFATLVVLAMELAIAIARRILRAPSGARGAMQTPASQAADLPPAPAPPIDDHAAKLATPAGTRRDAIARIGGGIAFATTGAILGWGALRTRFDVEVVELPIKIARLPRVLDGYSIVQLSDVHVGPFFGDRPLARAEELVRGLRPDLVVMTGDLINVQRRYVAQATSFLVRLSAMARHGVAAIAGNHEHYAGAPFVMSALRSAGIDALVNESRVLAKGDGGGFGLVGVDDVSATDSGGGPRCDAALAKLSPDAARVLLCHQPSYFPRAAAYGFDLMLAGHTHGGQIAPFGPLFARAIFHDIAGLVELDGARLYVNRGLGTSGPPSRVGIRPEITKIVLVAG